MTAGDAPDPHPEHDSAPARRGAALWVAAVVLALAGLGLVGWAMAHQVAAPSVALTGDAGDPGSARPIGAAPLEGGGAASTPVAGLPTGVRLSVVARPVPPGFRPGPLFGDGPGSLDVRVVSARPAAPPPAAAPAVPTRAVLPPSPPALLRVPAIGVDAPVGSVGLNPDRTMEVPAPGPTWDLPAWYRYSVTPGERGPSVVVGHVDSHVTGPSVFFDLARLRPGDVVEVTRADGVVARFAVRAVQRFAKDAFPTAAVYSGTAGPELRLITCGGTFDRAARSYRDNTVVFASAV